MDPNEASALILETERIRPSVRTMIFNCESSSADGGGFFFFVRRIYNYTAVYWLQAMRFFLFDAANLRRFRDSSRFNESMEAFLVFFEFVRKVELFCIFSLVAKILSILYLVRMIISNSFHFQSF